MEVTGRRSGKTISFPAVIADYDNGRYLVSMLGEDASWVRNVRAAGGMPCCATAAENRSYCGKLTSSAALRSCAATCSARRGARAHIPVDYRAPVEAFEPIAAQYPVFRVTAADGAGRQ